MIPSRRTTVGLILFQDTVNATMMKLFKIWCSLCHTECIDIYSAITSFLIFLPNQPMLMLQCVCRIQFHQGWGRGGMSLVQVPFPPFSMEDCVAVAFHTHSRKEQAWMRSCNKIWTLCAMMRVQVTQSFHLGSDLLWGFGSNARSFLPQVNRMRAH